MVNFGGHLRAILAEESQREGTGLFVVPYHIVKEMIFEQPSPAGTTTTTTSSSKSTTPTTTPTPTTRTTTCDAAQRRFEQTWLQALEDASRDFELATQTVWQDVFTALTTTTTTTTTVNATDTNDHAARGSPLGHALRLYLAHVGSDRTQDVLARLVRIHTVEITNSEALRKLVKKYDKRHAKTTTTSTTTTTTTSSQSTSTTTTTTGGVSATLLPRLYASSVYTGQAMLEDCISMLRALLNPDDNVNERQEQEQQQQWFPPDATFLPLDRKDSEAIHRDMVESRGEELEWLHRVVASVPSQYIARLVAHRGFHHVGDREDKRPLENSLAAYELAWTSGIHLCECDIALTKDEKIVLAHDEDFKRLALDSTSANSSKLVSELTFRELISMPLKSGVRPPLLIDVLRSAHAISEHAKLVIEVKPGNAEAGAALARLLIRHADLASCVAMVMSFDAFTMHCLYNELHVMANHAAAVDAMHGLTSVPSRLDLAGQVSMHRRYASFDHFGTFGAHSASPSQVGHTNSSTNHHFRRPSENDMMIGLDLSQRDLSSIAGNTSRTNLAEPPREIGHPDMVETPDKENSVMYIPKLMLLTVADEPKKPCEMRVGVHDLSPVDSWLHTKDGGSLDGVYLQFQKDMMTPEGAAAMQELSKRHTVGVWAYSGQDPDDFDTFHWLVEKCGVTFVNTDLPGHFRRGVFKRSNTSPL